MPSSDWGESWASFPGFDHELEQIIEKSTRLTKFLSEKATLQIEFAKKMRELAQKHQTKYTQIAPKNEKTAADGFSTNAAFRSLIGHTLKWTYQFESNAKSVMHLVQTDLSPTDLKTREKRTKINADHQRINAQFQEQQRRVTNSRAEHGKRKKEHDGAKMKYLRYRERNDKTIIEEDKLRMQSSDKEALAERAKEEFNRQVLLFNQFQKQYYTDNMPNLCRTLQDTHKNLTACWRVTLKEYVKSSKKDNEIEHQCNSTLYKDVDQIDRNQDADFVFNLRRKSSQLPIGLDLLEDNTILPSQSSIKNQNAEIFNKVADLTITKELHSPRDSRRSGPPSPGSARSSGREKKTKEESRRKSRDTRERSPRRSNRRESDVITNIQSQMKWQQPGTRKFDRHRSKPVMTDIPEPRSRPEGLSGEEGEFTEWDEASVMETFGKGKVLYDFVAETGDGCLNVKEGELIDISLRDMNGWSNARKLDSKEEGFIPTSYFELTE